MRITDLACKAVLVTGASTGIGAAVAKGFAAQGARVAVHYNSSEAPALQVLEEIRAAGGDAIALRADVRSVDACQSLVAEPQQRLGALDVLINDAGWAAPPPASCPRVACVARRVRASRSIAMASAIGSLPTGFIRQRSFIGAGRGAASRQWKSALWDG